MSESFVAPKNRVLILGLLCVASFAVVFNNLIITPILPAVSGDLGVRVSVGGLLVTAYALMGGGAAIFSGPLLARVGRKPVVVAGMGLLTFATILSAVAPNFLLLACARGLAGLGVACLTPAVFSAVGDFFDYNERGRAMSWVVAANTSASIFGVPIGALVSGFLSWRFTFGLLAGICLVFTWLLFAKLPRDVKREDQQVASGAGMAAVPRVLRDLPTAMGLLSNYLSTTYWFVFLTFVGAYYHDVFGLPTWALFWVTMCMGLGVLIGSNIGGRMSDRIGKRPVIIATSVICGVLLFLETTASPFLLVAAVILFLFGTSGGARFASAQALMTEMSPQYRTTVMALSTAGQQFGIVTGSVVGGLVLDTWGYTALGPAGAVIAGVAVVLYWLFVYEGGERAKPVTLATASGGQ